MVKDIEINPEMKEAIKLMVLGNYNKDDELGFNYDPNTGEILTDSGNPIPNSRISEYIIKAAEENGYNYIFIMDSDHTKTDKDLIFRTPDFINTSKNKGYSIAVESSEYAYKSSFGKSYTDIHPANMQFNKNSFIANYSEFIENKSNVKEQAKAAYELFFNAKNANAEIIFNEPSPEQNFYELSKSAEKLIKSRKFKKALEEKYTEVDYDNIIPVLKELPERIRFQERDEHATKTLEGKKAIVLRGAMHEMFTPDLDDKFSDKAICILNCEDEKEVESHLKLANGEIIARYNVNAILELLIKDMPEYASELKEYKVALENATHSKYEIPNLIIVGGKLYHGKTYYQTHEIEDMGITSNMYKYLIDKSYITLEDTEKQNPTKKR